MKNKLIENIISLFMIQGLNYLLPLVTFPYLVYTLGLSKFGLISFATAFIQYFILITDFGFNLSAPQQIAKNKSNKEEMKLIFNRVISAKIILLILSFIVLNIFVLLVPKFRPDLLLFNLSFITVVGNALFPVWFFQGLEQMKLSTIANIVSRIFSVALIFLLVHKESDYLLATFLQSFGYILAGIIGLVIVYSRFKISFYFVPFREIKRELKEGWSLFVSKYFIITI